MRTLRLLIVAAAAVTLLGCGQKGPLVLPDAERPHKKIGVPRPRSRPAPQSSPQGAAPGAPSPDAAAPSAPSAPAGAAAASTAPATGAPTPPP